MSAIGIRHSWLAELFRPKLIVCKDVAHGKVLHDGGKRIRASKNSVGRYLCPPCGCDCTVANGQPGGSCISGNSPPYETISAIGIDITSPVGVCVVAPGSASAKLNSAPADPNSTFTLRQEAKFPISPFGCCFWDNFADITSSTGSYTSFSGTTCGTSAGTISLLAFWMLLKVSGFWVCKYGHSGGQPYFFYGAIATTDPSNCWPSSSLTFTNAITGPGIFTLPDSGGSALSLGGGGGTATITFPP